MPLFNIIWAICPVKPGVSQTPNQVNVCWGRLCWRQSEEEALKLFSDSKEVLRVGGFNLRKFCTNSPAPQEEIDKKEGLIVSPPSLNSEETYTKTAFGQAQLVKPGEQKVLGVRRNKTTDQLCFGLDSIAQQVITLTPTKHNIVSIVGHFYDPMGFLVTRCNQILDATTRFVWEEAELGSAVDRRVAEQVEQSKSQN